MTRQVRGREGEHWGEEVQVRPVVPGLLKSHLKRTGERFYYEVQEYPKLWTSLKSPRPSLLCLFLCQARIGP